MTVTHTKLTAPRTLEIHEFTGRNHADTVIAAEQFHAAARRAGRKCASGNSPVVMRDNRQTTAQVRLHRDA